MIPHLSTQIDALGDGANQTAGAHGSYWFSIVHVGDRTPVSGISRLMDVNPEKLAKTNVQTIAVMTVNGVKNRIEPQRSQTTAVVTRCWVYWEKNADDGAAREEETGKSYKTRFADAVRNDITAVKVTEEHAEERAEWRWKIRCGDP